METFYYNADGRKAMYVYKKMNVFPLLDPNEILVTEKSNMLITLIV